MRTLALSPETRTLQDVEVVDADYLNPHDLGSALPPTPALRALSIALGVVEAEQILGTSFDLGRIALIRRESPRGLIYDLAVELVGIPLPSGSTVYLPFEQVPDDIAAPSIDDLHPFTD